MPALVRYARVLGPALGLAFALAFLVWDVVHLARLQLVYESMLARGDHAQFWSTTHVDPAQVKAGFWALALIADACFLMIAGFTIHAAWEETKVDEVVAHRSEGWGAPRQLGPRPSFRRPRAAPSPAPTVATQPAPDWVRAEESDPDYTPLHAPESGTRAA